MFIVTTVIFHISILIPTLLHYQVFAFFITSSQKKQLRRQYLLIFLWEIVVTAVLLLNGFFQYDISFYKNILAIAWIPYFFITCWHSRSLLSWHLYFFGMRSVFIMTTHAIIITGMAMLVPSADIPSFFPFHFLIQNELFILFFPLLRRHFYTVFVRYQRVSKQYIWKYLWPAPFFIFLDEFFFAVHLDDSIVPNYFIPRMCMAVITVLIGLSIQNTLSQREKGLTESQKHGRLVRQVRNMEQYTSLLQQSQTQMQMFMEHKDRHLQHIASLIQQNQIDNAFSYLQQLDKHITKTRTERYSNNAVINSALMIYITEAQKQHIPITVKLDVPQTTSIDADLSMVLSNLIENAIHASMTQPEDQRSIAVIAHCSHQVLNILVQNKHRDPVLLNDEGLPASPVPRTNHGLGMKSLSLFRKKYDASILCTQDDVYFYVYIQVRIPD